MLAAACVDEERYPTKFIGIVGHFSENLSDEAKIGAVSARLVSSSRADEKTNGASTLPGRSRGTIDPSNLWPIMSNTALAKLHLTRVA